MLRTPRPGAAWTPPPPPTPLRPRVAPPGAAKRAGRLRASANGRTRRRRPAATRRTRCRPRTRHSPRSDAPPSGPAPCHRSSPRRRSRDGPPRRTPRRAATVRRSPPPNPHRAACSPCSTSTPSPTPTACLVRRSSRRVRTDDINPQTHRPRQPNRTVGVPPRPSNGFDPCGMHAVRDQRGTRPLAGGHERRGGVEVGGRPPGAQRVGPSADHRDDRRSTGVPGEELQHLLGHQGQVAGDHDRGTGVARRPERHASCAQRDQRPFAAPVLPHCRQARTTGPHLEHRRSHPAEKHSDAGSTRVAVDHHRRLVGPHAPAGSPGEKHAGDRFDGWPAGRHGPPAVTTPGVEEGTSFAPCPGTRRLEGSRNSPTWLDQPKPAQRSSPSMALSFLYRLIRRVIEVVRVHRMDAAAKDAEILVLRHQLAVLHRQVARPRFTWSDRAFVALFACLVPRERWRSFLVSPQTILGWHRSLVQKRWTYPHRGPGRPSLPEETVNLICRLAPENPRWGYLRIVGELKKIGVCAVSY